MPPKKEIIVVLKDEEAFNTYVNPDNKKLVVIDVHPTWCGPCEMMFPTFKMLYANIDDFEKRVDILMLDYEKITQYKSEKFNRDPSSKPRFVFFSEGRLIDEVTGANIPELSEKIYKHIPMVY